MQGWMFERNNFRAERTRSWWQAFYSSQTSTLELIDFFKSTPCLFAALFDLHLYQRGCVLPLCNLHPALCVQKFYCVEWVQTSKKPGERRAAAVHFWGLGCSWKRLLPQAVHADKSFNLSQSVGGCGGILKTEPPVVEMTNELSSAPGEADARAHTQPTFGGAAAAKICLFVVAKLEHMGFT